MFDIQSLQSNSENPTFASILLAVTLAVTLSACIVITYEFTTNAFKKDNNYLQSLALISILAATVMQAVGDSLARGLGMLGALAIIRFRTTLRDPRNMTFMFASLAVGIACGVFGFTIAIVGTTAFCLMAIIIKFSPFGGVNSLTGELRFTMYAGEGMIADAEKVISQYCSAFQLNEFRTRDKEITLETEYNEYGKKVVTESVNERLREMTYDVKLKKGKDDTELLERFTNLEYVKEVRIKFSKSDDQL